LLGNCIERAEDGVMSRRGPHQDHEQAPVILASIPATDGGLDMFDQAGRRKGLGQEANGSGLPRLIPHSVFGERRNEHKRRTVPLGAHMGEEVHPAHAGHLHIRDDACAVVQLR
jgi:hypothetical protein